MSNTATVSRFKNALVLGLLSCMVLVSNVLIWAWAHQPQQLPMVPGKFDGVAYAPFRADQSPLDARYPSEAEVREDLQWISEISTAIRLYASSELPDLPRWAAEFGLSVNLGAWLNQDHTHNTRELERLYQSVAQYPNVSAVVVGNEALLRGELSLTQLGAYLDQARQRLRVPVSTAENWDLWLAHPELAKHVDYVAVHILPYWEGVPFEQAMARARERLDALQRQFPDKPIVVAEFGWPSAGERFQSARPGRIEQAGFARAFALELQQRGLQGFLMEAVDQPWKAVQEGKVGAYWGMRDAQRAPKWSLREAVVADPHWWIKALLSSVLALPLVVLALRHLQYLRVWGRLIMAGMLQLGCSLLVWLFGVPLSLYLSWLDWSMFLLLLPAHAAIIGILWIASFEFVEAVAQSQWRRRFSVCSESPSELHEAGLPLVSIHLACHNEPPDMVIETLEALAKLDYPNVEVLVVDNNTESDAIWQPVRDHCERLNAALNSGRAVDPDAAQDHRHQGAAHPDKPKRRFRFFHLRPWPGFKAGALNYALAQTDPDAEVIAVVDSDYVVERHWLSTLIGHFQNAEVVLVQSPQAHRDYLNSPFRRLCNFEYDGFFRIGMHHRNERNAIIQHGTMTLVRHETLLRVGGWAEWCICEDAELGLRLMQTGGDTRYVDTILGRGVTPADFAAYKSQRFRWAFGAMQILKHHWRALWGAGGNERRLSLGQRFHFLTGWFGWFADALHLLFSLLLVLWSVGMMVAPNLFTLPLMLFLLPVLGFCAVRAWFGVALYRACVPCSWRDTLGAALASMALSHAIARGVWKGLVSQRHPFERTAKQRRLRKQPSAWRAIREECLLAVGLLLSALAIAATLPVTGAEKQLWLALLIAQSSPYLASMLTAWIAAPSGRTTAVSHQ